ncbi:divergent PAP2 family protein [Paenibacillus sp. P26]|nr:divergent PAP2 family protein [Paenibacillus sp. P26]
MIGFDQGWGTPLFGLAVALTYIVMIDAVGIRRAVGESAKRINALSREIAAAGEAGPLRERQGHTRVEVLGASPSARCSAGSPRRCLASPPLQVCRHPAGSRRRRRFHK